MADPPHCPPPPPPAARVLRLRLAYDGTDFFGWQTQPGRPTVQQAVSDALRQITGETVVVHGSGRTDAGAHAWGQVAHLRLRAPIPAPALARALNARLPSAIRVLAAADAPPHFHARRDALAKLYVYRWLRTPLCSPFLVRYVHHYPYPLDEAAMIAAAADFLGAHDFTAFAARGDAAAPARPPDARAAARGATRRIFALRLRRRGGELRLEILGEGFLRHMVRNIAGHLAAVGRGARARADLPPIFASRQRGRGGPTLPARGLALARVFYDRAELAAAVATLASEADWDCDARADPRP